MRIRMLLIIGLGLALAGCSTIAGGPPRMTDLLPPASASGKTGQGDSRLQAIASAIKADCYDIPAADVAPGVSAKGRRNQLALAYMLRADEAYDGFESALMNDGRQLSFLATIASLGLATAGSTAGRNTARVLSAANAGVIGERTAFTKEYLFNETIPALQNQMRAERAAVRTRIYANLAKPVDEYPTCLALQDLRAYEQAGTLVGAIVGVTEGTAREKAHNETKALLAASELTNGTSPLTRALRNYLYTPDETLLAARVKALVGYAKQPAAAAGVSAEVYVSRIVSDDRFAVEQRALALEILKVETDPDARAPIVDALQ